VCASFVSFPLPTHSEIEHVANQTHSAMIITGRYVTKSLYTITIPGTTASSSSSGSMWSSGKGQSVVDIPSFLTDFWFLPLLSFLSYIPLSLVPIHLPSFPIDVTRHSKPNPSNAHSTDSSTQTPQTKRVALNDDVLALSRHILGKDGKLIRSLTARVGQVSLSPHPLPPSPQSLLPSHLKLHPSPPLANNQPMCTDPSRPVHHHAHKPYVWSLSSIFKPARWNDVLRYHIEWRRQLSAQAI